MYEGLLDGGVRSMSSRDGKSGSISHHLQSMSLEGMEKVKLVKPRSDLPCQLVRVKTIHVAPHSTSQADLFDPGT